MEVNWWMLGIVVFCAIIVLIYLIWKNLKDEKTQYGNLDHTIAYFEEVMKKGTKQCNPKGEGCTFELKYKTGKTEKVLVSGTKDEYITIPGGADSSRIIDTSKNLQSNVWKIIFPF